MKISKYIQSIYASVLLIGLFTLPAQAQSLADSIRGGWNTEQGGSTHTFLFVVKGSVVSGIYCTDCYNPNKLEFIDEGILTDNGLRFTLYLSHGNNPADVRQVEAVLDGETLQLTVQAANNSGPVETMALIRSERDLTPAAPSGGFVPARPYVAPSPAIQLNPENVTGLWMAGNGPGKQIFMFKRHKDGLRGMVCGPCIDAKNMAPLENIRIEGTQLYFDIVHENSGPGIIEHGPHRNVSVATISGNELHLATRPSFEDESYNLIHMTLLGPVEFRPN